MNANVINTQRFADRLKEAGMEDRPAAALSQALNDEFGNVAVKDDIASVREEIAAVKEDVASVREEVAALAASTKEDIAACASKADLDAATRELRAETRELRTEMLAGFKVMDARIKAVATIGRYTFAVVGLIAALTLTDRVASHFLPSAPPVAAAESASDDRPAPAPAGDAAPPAEAPATQSP